MKDHHKRSDRDPQARGPELQSKARANGRVDAWPLAKPVLGAAAERLADTVLVVVGRAASRAPPDRLPIVSFAA